MSHELAKRRSLTRNVKEIMQNAKKLAIPSKQEVIAKKTVADECLNLVMQESKKYDQVTQVSFGGSYAEGTWLAGDSDIDVFVAFKADTPEKDFEKISLDIGYDSMKEYKPYGRYSSHPFIEAFINGTKINVVPCYDVPLHQWKSAADRSPHHVTQMQNLTDVQKDDVRVLKLFMQSARVYGSEIAIQGFSGYSTEVLISKFGSFEEVMNRFATIKRGDVIGECAKKFDTPITITDPIDSNRNLAAAISEDSLGRFIVACRAFVESPYMEYFSPHYGLAVIESDHVVSISFDYTPRTPEAIWGQAKKAAKTISGLLTRAGFDPQKYTTHVDDSQVWLVFLLGSMYATETYKKVGPDIFSEHAGGFLSHNQSNDRPTWIDNGKVVTLMTREFTKASNFLDDLLRNKKMGIPSGLSADVENGFHIHTEAKNVPSEAMNKLCMSVTFCMRDFKSPRSRC